MASRRCCRFVIAALLLDTLIMNCALLPGYAKDDEKPSYEAEQLWAKGFELYKKHNYREAISTFEASLKADGKYFRSWNGKGICLAFLGQPEEGIKYISKSLEIKPDYENGHFNMALALELSGRYKDAVVSFDKALAVYPGNPWSHYGKACSYGMLGNATKAYESLKRAISMDPSIKTHARTEKDLAKVRNDPRIVGLLR